jgi:hypothetical protein
MVAGVFPTSGSWDPTGSIHSGSAQAYDGVVAGSVRDTIMSSENKATQRAPARSSRTRVNLEKLRDSKMPVIETIDVASLQLDESYGEDCDPYNSTGQFLVDALKNKHRD